MTDQTDYHRPRRPSAETISYLRSLPLDLDAALLEIQAFQSNGDADAPSSTDYPHILSAALSALYEIRHEVASLSGEEHASSAVEMLCRIALPVSDSAVRIVLESVAPYVLHLSTHRYGSHVLQTILQLVVATTATSSSPGDVDLALHEDAPVGPSTTVSTSIDDWMLTIASTLEEYATDLAVHICGSHVLRTMMCWLGGVELKSLKSNYSTPGAAAATLRRGKTKSKKKRKSNDATASTSGGGGSHHGSGDYFLIPTAALAKRDSATKNDRYKALMRFTTVLTVVSSTQGQQPGDVQRWACHSSAGPVLMLLLQIWTYIDQYQASSMDGERQKQLWDEQRQWQLQQATPDRQLARSRPEPHYSIGSMAHEVVGRILCWKTSTTPASEDSMASSVLYGMAGEPRGSHCLENILRLSPDSVYADLLTLGKFTDSSTIQDYIQDDTNNHSIDADEARNTSTSVGGVGCSNFVIQTVLQTIRTPAQAVAMLQAMDPSMPYILDPSNKRRGILWRMAEMAASYPECQEHFLRMISVGCHAVSNQSGTMASESTAPQTIKLNKCIPHLLNMHPPLKSTPSSSGRDGERWQIDVAGARAIYYMLQFQPSNVVKDTLKGIFEMPVEHIEALAKDSLGSRCIVDGILDRSSTLDVVFLNATKRLLLKLNSRWASLAADRVGHHAVKKLFQALRDMKDKETLVQELLLGKNRMIGNNMGRSVLDALEMRVYETQGEAEWSKLIRSTVKKEEWLKEIVDSDPIVKRKTTATSTNGSSAKKGRITASVDSIVSAIAGIDNRELMSQK